MRDVENVIEERLKYQSTQRKLEQDFGVRIDSVKGIKGKTFLRKFDRWEPKKQNQFFVLVGGRANFKNTKIYIKSLI
jgi:hypothetical protein